MARPYLPDLLDRIAPRIGARITRDPVHGMVGVIRLPNGMTTHFYENQLNINPLASFRIARDKSFTSSLLRAGGFRVPKEVVFLRDDLIDRLGGGDRFGGGSLDRLAGLSWPLYVKPGRLSRGRHVTKVSDESSFLKAAARILKQDRVLIVQETCPGRDYRVIVVDDRVLCAYERLPLRIVGNGIDSVAALIARKQRSLQAAGRDVTIDPAERRVRRNLEAAQVDLDTVPALGREIVLLEVANLSLGGDLIDCSDQIHPVWRDIAVAASREIGLRFCGVDILCRDIRQEHPDHVILELNGAPGLEHYQSLGPAQKRRTEAVYTAVLRAIMRPAPTAVTGTGPVLVSENAA